MTPLPDDIRQPRTRKLLPVVLGMLVLVSLGAMTWAGDVITLQGERTIYTVDCAGGAWVGPRCSGTPVAGGRYRFRALKPHGEVVFWTVGQSGPSGKFSNCQIADGRNWTCGPGADAPMTITLQMVHGRAAHNNNWPTRPFHATTKWRWVLLKYGLGRGEEPDA